MTDDIKNKILLELKEHIPLVKVLCAYDGVQEELPVDCCIFNPVTLSASLFYRPSYRLLLYQAMRDATLYRISLDMPSAFSLIEGSSFFSLSGMPISIHHKPIYELSDTDFIKMSGPAFFNSDFLSLFISPQNTCFLSKSFEAALNSSRQTLMPKANFLLHDCLLAVLLVGEFLSSNRNYASPIVFKQPLLDTFALSASATNLTATQPNLKSYQKPGSESDRRTAAKNIVKQYFIAQRFALKGILSEEASDSEEKVLAMMNITNDVSLYLQDICNIILQQLSEDTNYSTNWITLRTNYRKVVSSFLIDYLKTLSNTSITFTSL